MTQYEAYGPCTRLWAMYVHFEKFQVIEMLSEFIRVFWTVGGSEIKLESGDIVDHKLSGIKMSQKN